MERRLSERDEQLAKLTKRQLNLEEEVHSPQGGQNSASSPFHPGSFSSSAAAGEGGGGEAWQQRVDAAYRTLTEFGWQDLQHATQGQRMAAVPGAAAAAGAADATSALSYAHRLPTGAARHTSHASHSSHAAASPVVHTAAAAAAGTTTGSGSEELLGQEIVLKETHGAVQSWSKHAQVLEVLTATLRVRLHDGKEKWLTRSTEGSRWRLATGGRGSSPHKRPALGNAASAANRSAAAQEQLEQRSAELQSALEISAMSHTAPHLPAAPQPQRARGDTIASVATPWDRSMLSSPHFEFTPAQQAAAARSSGGGGGSANSIPWASRSSGHAVPSPQRTPSAAPQRRGTPRSSREVTRSQAQVSQQQRARGDTIASVATPWDAASSSSSPVPMSLNVSGDSGASSHSSPAAAQYLEAAGSALASARKKQLKQSRRIRAPMTAASLGAGGAHHLADAVHSVTAKALRLAREREEI